jgi:hypothetical protein
VTFVGMNIQQISNYWTIDLGVWMTLEMVNGLDHIYLLGIKASLNVWTTKYLNIFLAFNSCKCTSVLINKDIKLNKDKEPSNQKVW